MERRVPTAEAHAYQKARRINLDSATHGTLAEIGAGQEVARWFFHVGGAAATVAKTISAYDMAVSDALYGPTDRYVSRKRLHAMLDREFEVLLSQLFKAGVRLYIYPSVDPETDTLVTLDTLAVPEPLGHLFAHLKAQRRIEPIRGAPSVSQEVLPREVLRRLQVGDATWEALVPAPAARLIKERRLFLGRDAVATPPPSA